MGVKDVPQPDLFLRILPEHGGQSSSDGSYAAGASELIVEVSASSLSRDLGIKLELYRSAGVREYLTVLLQPQKVIWRQLSRGRYREMEPGGRRTSSLAHFSRLLARSDGFVDSQTLRAHRCEQRRAIPRACRFCSPLGAAHFMILEKDSDRDTMTNKKNSRLTEAIIETAGDLRRLGIIDTAAHEKITIRQLGARAPLPLLSRPAKRRGPGAAECCSAHRH